MTWNEWQCPCPECNGYRDLMSEAEPDYEPEHPENECPKPVGFWFYADTLK